MIWDVSTGRFDGGWIIETAVPFKSLRYQPGADQVWGINVVRTNRWKNELSFLNPVPKERGQAGVHFSSVTGLLQGNRRAVRIGEPRLEAVRDLQCEGPDRARPRHQ